MLTLHYCHIWQLSTQTHLLSTSSYRYRIQIQNYCLRFCWRLFYSTIFTTVLYIDARYKKMVVKRYKYCKYVILASIIPVVGVFSHYLSLLARWLAAATASGASAVAAADSEPALMRACFSPATGTGVPGSTTWTFQPRLLCV